ncbi:MAG: DUF523 domain-containing protein [archaeon]
MIIISACLAGVNCKYNGENNKNDKALQLVNKGKAIILCPEILGGLDIPRIPCEIVEINNKSRVINKKGIDKTTEFYKGAKKTLEIAKIIGANKAILKSKSPSCGVGKIYDGSFSGKLVDGNGITADLLIENGIEVISDNNL